MDGWVVVFFCVESLVCSFTFLKVFFYILVSFCVFVVFLVVVSKWWQL